MFTLFTEKNLKRFGNFIIFNPILLKFSDKFLKIKWESRTSRNYIFLIKISKIKFLLSNFK